MSQQSLEAKIVSADGIAAVLPHAVKGMVGISISNHFFSNEHVMGIVRLGLKLCDDFSIVIFDYPERWNWPLKQNSSQAKNEKQCLAIGQEKKSAYIQQLKKLGLDQKVPILTWADIMTRIEYKRNLAATQDEFTSNPDFRAGVIRQLHTNLNGRLQSLSLGNAELLPMCNYLIEEIAGLFYLQFDLGHQIDLYPKPQMQIIERIYANAYPRLSARLGYDWQKQNLVVIGF